MSSILTNAASLTALQNLTNTQNSLGKLQSQLSTGKSVQSAADNAAYWSIATTMESDKGAWGSIGKGLKNASSALDSVNTSLTNAISVVSKMKQQALAAEDPTASVTDIQANLAQLGSQLKQIVTSSSYNGVNLLDDSTKTNGFDVASSYNNGGGAAASAVGTIHLATKSLVDVTTTTGILQAAKATSSAAATDLTGVVAADLSAAKIKDTVSNIDKALADLNSYASSIGSTQSRITDQQDFVTTVQKSLTNGISALVDADMNEVSTRLQALQTQQQLGVQSLSIANQSSQMILRLFQ